MKKLSLLLIAVLTFAILAGCGGREQPSSAGSGQFGEAPVENEGPTEETVDIHQLWMSNTTKGVAWDFSDPERIVFTADFDEEDLESDDWETRYYGRIIDGIQGQTAYDKVFDEPPVDMTTNAPRSTVNFHYLVCEITQKDENGTITDLENPNTFTVWFWLSPGGTSGREVGQFHFLDGWFYYEKIDVYHLISVSDMIANPMI